MTKRLLAAALAAGAMSLGACSTIVEGTHQDITVNTNPSGANCALNRENAEIARVSGTPGSVKIEKTKHDITIVCNKDGYQQATYLNHSGAAMATFGNMILGGGIGWAVDSATGSDNKYESPVNITLVPVMPAAPAAAPGASSPPASKPSS